jgi:Transposase
MAMVAGIDWASETHVCCAIDDTGRVIDRFDVAHDASSLRAMAKRLVRLGVSGVAIERGDGPVVEVLMDAEIPVFVVPSRQVKGLRSRYGSAGNKDDRFDASCWRTRCAPTVTAGPGCATTAATPRRCERCAGPDESWWRCSSPH